MNKHFIFLLVPLLVCTCKMPIPERKGIELRSPCFKEIGLDSNRNIIVRGSYFSKEYNEMELECFISFFADTQNEEGNTPAFDLTCSNVQFVNDSTWLFDFNSIDSIVINRPAFGVFKSMGALKSSDTLSREYHIRLKNNLKYRVLSVLGKGDFEKFSAGIVINFKNERVFNKDINDFAKNLSYSIVDNYSLSECGAYWTDNRLIYYPNR